MLATALFSALLCRNIPRLQARFSHLLRPVAVSLQFASGTRERAVGVLPYHFDGYESSRWSLVVGVAGIRKFGLACLRYKVRGESGFLGEH
jgi:hypothetical protein